MGTHPPSTLQAGLQRRCFFLFARLKEEGWSPPPSPPPPLHRDEVQCSHWVLGLELGGWDSGGGFRKDSKTSLFHIYRKGCMGKVVHLPT